MCKYCEKEKPLHRHNPEYMSFREYYSEIGCTNGKYYIYNSIKTDERKCGFEFDINYCPMCGRRLGDD